MLNDFIVHDCLDKLLTNNDEVALECLCILLTVISKDLEYNETKMDHYFNSMEYIVTEGKTSPRIRYMLQDTIDLVSLNLVPRKAEQDPKPVQQIHNEATIEDQEEPRSVQQPLLSEDTKIQPDDAPTLQTAGLRSASPGLVLPEAPVATLQPQASSPAQVPTPPQNQGSEARGTLESRTGSSKKRRRRRKLNNQLQTAGLRSASPGLVLPGAPGESGEAQATTPPTEPELPLPASLSPPSIVEELLNFNNSKHLQCLHSDASSSEATLSEGSWSPWELQKQMLGIMLEDMACDSDIFDCLKERLERSQKSSSPYLTELMTAVCQAAVKENTSCPVHAALLQKGLPVVLEDQHSEKEQQMKALKDLQELIVTLDGPPNLLRMFFTCMCDEDISSEDSCIKSGTGKDQDEQLGKGVALQTVTAFFTWLREAEPHGN